MHTDLAEGPTITVGARTLRFLGVELEADGGEVYEVCLRLEARAPWREAKLRHGGGASWDVFDGNGTARATLALGLPDEVFALALGEAALALDGVAEATVHWPAALQERLARRRASGPCTIAFDGRWFLSRLTGSPIDRPLLLRGVAGKLGIEGLVGASEVVAAAARGIGESSVIGLLQRGLEAPIAASPSPWGGEGRLIGESTWGELSQVGTDIAEGCSGAVGIGPLRVFFAPDEPMGLGFGPEVPSADVVAGRPQGRDASAGTGAEVGVIEPGGAAEVAGVRVGMVATQLSSGDLVLHFDAVPTAFEDILEAIDLRRDAGEGLALTFATSAPLTHWYAVEMPAAATLAAFGATAGEFPGALAALCGRALLWQEPIPRLFLGAPGSVTSAHVDICPQVQLAQGLLGTKVLGVASHTSTPRLVAEHGGSEEEEATHVPTDRPLSPRQAALLGETDLSLVLLQQGDLVVLHSGALHFASNGADGLAGSVYHGVMTAAALPRLRLDAAASGGLRADNDAYGGHLYAADLLQLVEDRLRRL